MSIIGPGRLGTALAIALRDAGYQILALVGREPKRVAKSAAWLGPQTLSLTAKQLEFLPLSEVIVISTPDDTIAQIAKQLAALKNLQGGGIVFHTSGALSSALLSPLAKMGLHTGSIHPLVSVSNPRMGARGLRGAYYCIEGDPQAVKIARQIVSRLKGQSFSIKSDKKAIYHAAALLSSGHLVALLDIAIEMLLKCGLKRSEAQTVLLPLVQSSINNLAASNPERALTGTFARGDEATMLEHIKSLQLQKMSEALAVYKLLGRRSLKVAARGNLNPEVEKRLERLLDRAKD